jgi:Zn-dependent protease with chaperone function
MPNWIRRKCASLYGLLCGLLGYERLEGEERNRLEELAGDDLPHEIWIGDSGPQALFGNVMLNKSDYNSYSRSEIEAIFLHEMGHVRDIRGKLSSYKSLFLYSFVAMILIFTSFAVFVFSMLLVISALGWTTVSLLNLFVAFIIAAPISLVLSLALLWIPTLRIAYPKYEYSADKYATKRGYGEELVSVLKDKKGGSAWYYIRNPRDCITWAIYPSSASRIEKMRQIMEQEKE